MQLREDNTDETYDQIDREIDDLMATAHEFDEADEAKRMKYGNTLFVPNRKVSREIFPLAKRKGATVIFEGE